MTPYQAFLAAKRTPIPPAGFVAARWHRRGLGIELKASYYESAIRNVARAVADRDRPTLFDLMAAG